MFHFDILSFIRKEIIIVFLLLFIALVLRLIYLSHLKANDPDFYNPPPGTDMLTYDNYAKQILDGTFSNKEPYFYGPLYFYFLALIYKLFGIDAGIARLIQMLLGVFTTFLTYLIAKKVFNKTVGYISLIISILYGMFYIHEGVLLMESLVTFLNILSIFLLLKVEDNPSYKNFAYSGVVLGLSALARANILLFIPFILIWLLIIKPQKGLILNPYSLQLKRFGFLCLITLLTISPVTIRNYLVSGKFVLISTNGPVNFWIGNNPYAEGWFAYPPSEYSKKITKLVEEKGDKAYIEEVARFAKEYPRQYLKLLFKKFSLFWDSTEIANNVNYELYKDLSWVLKLAVLSFGLIGSLALLGILFSLKVWRKSLLFYLFTLSFMLSTISFFVLERYRIALIPIFIPFAGFGILWLYEKIKLKQFQAFFLSLIPLLFFLSLTHSKTIDGMLALYIHPDGFRIQREKKVMIRDDSGLLHGIEYYDLQSSNDMIKKELIINKDLNKFKEAVFFFNFEFFTKLPKIEIIFEVNGNRKEIPFKFTPLTSICKVYFNPNILLQGKNTIIIKPKIEKGFSFRIIIDKVYSFKRSYFLNKNTHWEALKNGEFMIWLNLSPERSIGGFMAQGIEYFKNKKYDKAIFEFEEVLKRSFGYPNVHYSLGLVYEKMGILDRAIKEYKEEINIGRAEKEIFVETHNNLARIYYTKGMIKQAIEECRNILALDPKNKQAYNNLINLEKILDLDKKN